MTKTKLKLEFISNDAARKATFKKRTKSLMKKVSEISTLCGIQACLIMFSPYDPQAEFWPSAAGVERVVTRFREMPEWAQRKNMLNQESYLKKMIVKFKGQIRKQEEENYEMEMTHIMFQCLNGIGREVPNGTDLNYLGRLIDQKLENITKSLEALEEGQSQSQAQAI